MSGFKIHPPSTPSIPGQGSVGGPDRPESASEKSFELTGDQQATSTSSTDTKTDPASLIQQLRDGHIDIDEAVEILIDQALRDHPIESAPESLRQEIRQALTELVRDDPTLSAFTSAMKR